MPSTTSTTRCIKLAGGGTDSILAEVGNVSLADYDNVEVLSLTTLAGATNASGSDRSDSLNGNTFINTLTGGIGNDTLDGGGSDDVMKGELGNDFYYVGSAGDQVIEAIGEGKDTVFASANYQLTAGQEIEVLSLQGIAGLSGTGNEFANTIIGNDGNNILDGGKGNDTLTGGKGNDIYVVDSAADKVYGIGGPRHRFGSLRCSPATRSVQMSRISFSSPAPSTARATHSTTTWMATAWTIRWTAAVATTT